MITGFPAARISNWSRKHGDNQIVSLFMSPSLAPSSVRFLIRFCTVNSVNPQWPFPLTKIKLNTFSPLTPPPHRNNVVANRNFSVPYFRKSKIYYSHTLWPDVGERGGGIWMNVWGTTYGWFWNGDVVFNWHSHILLWSSNARLSKVASVLK